MARTMNHLTGRHSYAERGHDCYSTPPVAVEALLEVEALPYCIWEPCAGRGAITDVLRQHGHEVVATDLIDYGIPNQLSGVDFLKTTAAPAGVTAIVTNPPYKLAEAFVAHAIGLVPLAIFLLRLSFLESRRRTQILEGGALARIWVFRNRIPNLHRHDWVGPRASNAVPYAFYVFDRNHNGPITLDRTSWMKELSQ